MKPLLAILFVLAACKGSSDTGYTAASPSDYPRGCCPIEASQAEGDVLVAGGYISFPEGCKGSCMWLPRECVGL